MKLWGNSRGRFLLYKLEFVKKSTIIPRGIIHRIARGSDLSPDTREIRAKLSESLDPPLNKAETWILRRPRRRTDSNLTSSLIQRRVGPRFFLFHEKRGMSGETERRFANRSIALPDSIIQHVYTSWKIPEVGTFAWVSEAPTQFGSKPKG